MSKFEREFLILGIAAIVGVIVELGLRKAMKSL
jgi:hypothetical protein